MLASFIFLMSLAQSQKNDKIKIYSVLRYIIINLISGTTQIKRMQLINLDNALYSQECIFSFDRNL